jgi:prevent-host-death family protein
MVIRKRLPVGMQEIAISEFKAKCLALLERVCKTKKPIRITRFGRPIAEVFPPSPAQDTDWVGSMADSIEFVGDVVAPVIEERDLEALR